MKLQNKRGFTLIELLVVITIIGILATGATTVYTSQIQKARDTTRINDIKAIQSAVEQVYQDRAVYPPTSSAFITDPSGWVSVKTYMPRLPRDPKNGQTCAKWVDTAPTSPLCVYVYKVKVDSNWIKQWAYALATAFESSWKIKSDGKKDGGQSNDRWELWNLLSVTSGANAYQSSDIDLSHTDTLETTIKSATGVSNNAWAPFTWNDTGYNGTTTGPMLILWE